MSADPSRWREHLVAHIRLEARPAHKYGHQPRLYQLTQQIAAATPSLDFDDDVTFAAAYLHDLGVFIGHRPEDPILLEPWDHVAYACERSPALLESFGFPVHKIEHVLQCIREHQPKDEPHSVEAILLRDADILEQLGAVSVLRTAAKLGGDTRFVTFGDAVSSLERALQNLPAQLRLDASRELARPRIRALQQFLAALAFEAGADLH